jgi:hypothetical protein
MESSNSFVFAIYQQHRETISYEDAKRYAWKIGDHAITDKRPRLRGAYNVNHI